MALRDDYKAAVSLKNHFYRQAEYTSSRFHRSMKIEKDEDANSQKHVVKVPKLIHKLGGHFGQVRRLLHPGGRVTNGIYGITTTQNTLWRSCQGTKNSALFVVQEFIVTHSTKAERARTEKPGSLSDFQWPCRVS